MVLDNLPVADKTSLALTSTGFYKAMSGYELWHPAVPGMQNPVKSQVLKRMENRGDCFQAGKLLVCSYCLTFHTMNYFSSFERFMSPAHRKCFLVFGQARLGPHYRLSWLDVLAMRNNSYHRECAVIGRERSLWYDGWSMKEGITFPDRIFRVVIDIHKLNHTIYVRTRWDFPYLTGAARLGAQWYYLDSLPEVLELCPHNNFKQGATEGWIGRQSRRRCEEQSHGFGCMCYDLQPQRTTRCRFCATDIYHGIQDDCYYIMTDKILGCDTYPESREWQSHSSEDERGLNRYTLSRMSDDAAMREGGTIRNILESLQNGTNPRAMTFPTAKVLWADDCRLKDVRPLRSLNTKPLLQRLRVCELLRKVPKPLNY